MMEKFKNTRGAVSVFLVIILVPCMLVSSLFVDLGRVELSKEMALSSGDLALNTLMTKYDADLKEYYGLIASCQDIDSFYDITAQYFWRTISSQEMSDDEIMLLSDYYSAAMNNDKIYDLLSAENVGKEDEDIISPVKGANLANATMIKEQIVEFMKYRAPIELLSGLLSNLKGMNGALSDTESDNNLIDAKQAFYEAENKVNSQGYDIYKLIKEYQEKSQENGDVKQSAQTIADNINSYEQKYREIHEALVKDLYNTAGLGSIKRSAYDINSNEYKAEKYYKNSDSDCNLANENDVKDLIKAFSKKLTEFYSAKAELENVFTSAGYSAATYDIQYWVRINGSASDKLSVLNVKLTEMLKSYNALENAISYMDYEETDKYNDESAEKWKIEGEGNEKYEGYNEELTTKQHYEKIKEQFAGTEGIYNRYMKAPLTSDENNGDLYIKYMSIIERISQNPAYLSAINSNTHIIPSGGKSVSETITEIHSQITEYRSRLTECRDILNKIITDDNGKGSKIDNFKEAVEKYPEMFNNWNGLAENSETENGKIDKDDINEKEIKKKVKEINGDDVADLKNRLIEIKKVYDNLIACIDELKYGQKAVKDIDSFEAAKAASGIQESNIGLTNDELNNYVSNSFSYTKKNGENVSVTINDNNHPDLDNEPKPKVYKWMLDNKDSWSKNEKEETECKKCHKKFKKYEGITSEQASSQNFDTDVCPECAYEEIKPDKEESKYNDESISSNASGDIKKTYKEKEAEDFPSGFKMAEISASDSMKGLVSLAGNLFSDFNGTVTSMRDNLYTMEYVFGMFTHSAYEKEHKYNLIKDKLNKNEINLSDLGISDFTKVQAGEFENICSNNEKVKQFWESEAATDTYNKSLTNKLINTENNFAYGGEIEYIMKGLNNDENIKGIYGAIYAIRYLLNTPAAFSTFWNFNNLDKAPSEEIKIKIVAIDAISAAVSSATGGIIPKALVKTGLILIENAVETAIDIDYLKAGLPVKLVKSKNDVNWGPTRTTEDNGGYFQYSDYLYIFLLLGMNENEQAVYSRIGDVMQANMRHITGENGKNYKLSLSVTYFRLSATLRVKPLMITLPYFSGYENDLDSKTDWCTYTINTVRGY